MTDSTLTVEASSKPAEAADFPLPGEDRFTCLPGCGLCCSYRVLVTEADRQQLQAACRAGLHTCPPATSEPFDFAQGDVPWEAAANGEMSLRRTPDFCLFLDHQRRCAVYEHRPEHCRAYPYLWTTYVRPELDVDFSCPGLGHGDAIPAEWCQPPVENAAWQSQREAALREIQGLLRAQRRYAAPEMLAVLGERCLDELAALWAATQPAGSATLSVSVGGQTQLLFVNGQTEDDLTALWQGLSLTPQSVEELFVDAVFMERHFGRPRWNTRLGPEGEVALYRFWIAERVLRVEERGGAHREAPLGDVGHIPWQPEAIATRRAYLERWLKRQLPVRLANNTGLASLIPGGHVAVHYLQFLLEIDHRLAVLAPALARAGGKDAIDRDVALGAVRGSDGLLRAWCQSARLGVTN